MRSFIFYLFIFSALLLSCAKEERTVEVIEKQDVKEEQNVDEPKDDTGQMKLF